MERAMKPLLPLLAGLLLACGHPAAPAAAKPADRVDPTTLTGKVMCGYQGWFTAAGDGSKRPWVHYSWKGGFEPGRCSIDLWPDLTDLDPDERYATPFRHADGRVAKVFSSHNRKTVVRHFQWMRQYGIDGAFVQRFAVRLRSRKPQHWEQVLVNCRAGAKEHGRAYAVMYDLSGLRAGETSLVKDDWMRLRKDVTRDAMYLRHRGRPLVAVWGVGFNDGRKYTLAECERLIEFLKSDAGGRCAVMLGVPTYWRTLGRDSLKDPAVHRVLAKADVVSPWAVGRFRGTSGAAHYERNVLRDDVAWCAKKKVDLLPVVFPGFSWHNMKPEAKLGHIPREKGRFLWSQFVGAKAAGAKMIYVAMFDEIDEATAIFKCTNDPPVGRSTFLTYEGLPSDHYLWLTGQGARLLRGEIKSSKSPPARRP
jgi:hypothetical protein